MRRRPLEIAAHEFSDFEPSRVMFILCSENAASAELVAAFPAAYVLQCFGGVPSPIDAATRATIEYGLLAAGVRQIVVCGHEKCSATEDESNPARLVSQCRALHRDDQLGPLLRHTRVTTHALFFEETSHDVYACDLEERSTKRIDEIDLITMLLQRQEP